MLKNELRLERRLRVVKSTHCLGWAGVAAFDAITQRAEADGSEFKASLAYRASSRATRTTRRNPVSKKK